MNLLITGAWQQAEEVIPKLTELGHKVVFMKQESQKLPCDYSWPEGVICNGLFLHHAIEGFSSLTYIQVTSAGLDRVPVDYCHKHGIAVRNARGVYSIPIAEYVLCGVLQLYKESYAFRDSQRRHAWEKRRELRELCNEVVAILGCGSVGTECAKRFKAFGATVLGVDSNPRMDTSYDSMVGIDGLDAVLKRADVVVIALPLTRQTEGLLDRKKLSLMRNGSIVVNVSRGRVMDENALVIALGHNLRGAVLDVFEREPLSEDSPLWEMENVIVTPHNSFVSPKNKTRLCNLIVENLVMYEEWHNL